MGTKSNIEPSVVKLFIGSPSGPVIGVLGVTLTAQMFEMFMPTPPS